MSYAPPIQQSALQEQGVPDGTLVKRALAGDQCAFDCLVSRYHRFLAAYIQDLLKDDEQVSDVLQQVFLQLFLSLPILLRTVPLKAWLLQVARNRCLDELRRRRRQATTPFSTLERLYGEEAPSLVEAIPDPQLLPEEVVERTDLYCSLHQAIASLPAKFRSVVLLHCFNQLTFAEIGRKLHMPASTAKTYYYRSLPHLRSALVANVPFASIS